MFTRALAIIAVFLAGFCYTTLPSAKLDADLVPMKVTQVDNETKAWLDATEQRIAVLEELVGVNEAKVTKYVRSDIDVTKSAKASKAVREESQTDSQVVEPSDRIQSFAEDTMNRMQAQRPKSESDEEFRAKWKQEIADLSSLMQRVESEKAMKSTAGYGSTGSAVSGYGSTGSAVSGYGSTGYSSYAAAPVTYYSYSGGSNGYSAYRGGGSTGYSSAYAATPVSYSTYRGPVRGILSRLPILRRFAARSAMSASYSTPYSMSYSVSPSYSTTYSTSYSSSCGDPNCTCVDCDCVSTSYSSPTYNMGTFSYSSPPIVSRSVPTGRIFSSPRTVCDKVTGQCYMIE